MLYSLLILITGIMIGQEYTLPNVKNLSLELYYTIKKTEFYKKITSDFNKEN